MVQAFTSSRRQASIAKENVIRNRTANNAREEDGMSNVEIKITQRDVEEAIAEWERKHPGRKFDNMSPSEFSDLMMKRIVESSRRR